MLIRSASIVGLSAFAVLVFGLIAVADKPIAPEKDKIRQALEGNSPGDSSGDGVLDDVLNVIKQRGSVLDGSSLDVQRETIQKPVSESQKARVAEQLLKSARMLESLGEPDRQQALLIRQIRGQARNLLSD